MERYARNASCIAEKETEYLHSRHVAIVGLGGLGGYAAELLARVGVGRITGIDDDRVEVTNLNRQLLANGATLGMLKVMAAEQHIMAVNPDVVFRPLNVRLDAKNAEELLAGSDLVLDCSDGIPTRLILEAATERLGIPLVHGAIAGWYGQVGVCFPGDRLLSAYYAGCEDAGAEADLGNPSFTPAVVAALQAAEAVKVLLNRGDILRGRLLYLDLLQHQYDVLDMGENQAREEKS